MGRISTCAALVAMLLMLGCAATAITIIEGGDPAASALIPVGFEMPPFSGRVGRQE